MSSLTIAGTFDNLRAFLRSPLQTNAIPIAVSAILVAGLGFAAYKVYELKVTGGVGFIEADEMAVEDGIRISAKKRAFFDTLRPVVEAENARILELRERLLTAREQGEGPNWIRDVAREYEIEWTGREWTKLLRRVDAVPVPLVLAQAANESSWGQSRFAQEGNNLFGQWCFEPGCGIVPNQRPEGEIYEVASFGSVNESVRSYLRNLNTHPAYTDLRKRRMAARQAGREPTGVELASGLGSYSERGQAYIDEIRSTIRVNRDLMLGVEEEQP